MSSTGEVMLHDCVGYNYVAAVLALLRVMSYQQLATSVGYRSKGSLSRVLDGATPTHIHGEAIWALYVERFNEKPPMSVRQSGHPPG